MTVNHTLMIPKRGRKKARVEALDSTQFLEVAQIDPVLRLCEAAAMTLVVLVLIC